MKKKLIWFVVFIALTLLISFLLQNLLRRNNPILVSSLEPDLTERISPTKEIKINFDREIGEDKNYITVVIAPEINFAHKWEESALEIKPELFEPGREYQLGVYYKNQLIKISEINVLNVEELDEEELNEYNTTMLFVYSSSENAYLEENPWISNLPIIKPEYVITYDFENSSVRVRILNSANLTEEELDKIREAAAKDLVTAGGQLDNTITYVED